LTLSSLRADAGTATEAAASEGDSVQAIVIDNGGHLMKVGFGGDEAPQAVFPTVVGRFRRRPPHLGQLEACVGHEAMARRLVLNLREPIRDGAIHDWEDMEMLWKDSFHKELKVAPEEHPVLLTEPPLNPKPNREKTLQIMFEKFSVPACYLAMDAVLALYASGRTTGAVLMSREHLSHVVPIYEGHAMPHAIRRLDYGGAHLVDELMRLLNQQGVPLTTSADRDIVRDIKQKLGYVSAGFERELKRAAAMLEEKEDKKEDSAASDSAGFAGSDVVISDDARYELPDGQFIVVGSSDRFRCAEPLFRPQLIGREAGYPGVHTAIAECIAACDADVRSDLYRNIVLAGGTTLFEGLQPRLEAELAALVPKDTKLCVVAPPERKYSVWIGGSILSSMPAFAPLWISKQEYDETGPAIVHRKCF
jgi:actin